MQKHWPWKPNPRERQILWGRGNKKKSTLPWMLIWLFSLFLLLLWHTRLYLRQPRYYTQLFPNSVYFMPTSLKETAVLVGRFRTDKHWNWLPAGTGSPDLPPRNLPERLQPNYSPPPSCLTVSQFFLRCDCELALLLGWHLTGQEFPSWKEESGTVSLF